jgi:lambda repressor-like predicted transcriptional regulator
MTHLEFVNKLNESGISIRSTNIENGMKVYPVSYGLSSTRDVVIENLRVRWAERQVMDVGYDALQSLIAKAIDMDSWKHSWYHQIMPQNYEKFRGIIQDKILERAAQIEELLTVYFILGKEISESVNKDLDIIINHLKK